MNEIDEYMTLIVEPAFIDVSQNVQSVRHAYLACLAIYHVIDRAAYPDDPRNLAEQWKAESLAFTIVDEVAQHFKHGTRRWVKKMRTENPDALLITNALGLEGALEDLETRNLYFQIRDAIEFVRNKVGVLSEKNRTNASAFDKPTDELKRP